MSEQPVGAPPPPQAIDFKIDGNATSYATVNGDLKVTNAMHLGPAPRRPLPIEPPVPEQRIRGREDLIDTIVEAALSPDGRPWVLHGMGGGGKSTIASGVAARLRTEENFKAYWVWGTTEADLHQSMLSVAEDRGADKNDIIRARADWHQAHQLVWKSLTDGDRPWLLVMDNVDDPSILAGPGGTLTDESGWLRSSKAGLVLITSRYADRRVWGSKAQLRKVGPLEPATGAGVLVDLAPDCGDATEAALLSDRLGGVPLALYLAGSYLAYDQEDYQTFAEYRAALDTVLVELIDKGGDLLPSEDRPDDVTARRSVRETWELSLRMLTARRTPLARPLLRLLSCFGAPHPLRRDLLPAEVLAGSVLDPDGALTKDDISTTIKRLGAVSLLDQLTLPDKARAMQLHPLVCEVIATSMTAEDQDALWSLAQRCLVDATPEDPADPQEWPAWATLPPVYTSVLKRLPQTCTGELSETLLMANVCGTHLTITGSLKEAHDLVQLTIERAQRLPDDDPVRLHARFTATLVSREEGALKPLVGELRSLLADAEVLLEPDNGLLLAIRQNLASLFSDLMRFDEAEDQYARMMQDCEEPPSAARFGYGQLLTQRGEFDRAESLFQEIYDEELAEQGPEHPGTLATREAIAGLIAARGDLSGAQREYAELLEIQERVFGHDSLATLNSRTSLLGIHALQGELGEAQGQLKTVLRIQRDSLNPEHPLSLLGLGLLTAMRNDDDPETAADRLRGVREALVRLLGVDHPAVLVTRFQLAIKQFQQGEEHHLAAETECKAVLRQETELWGGEHPLVLATNMMAALMTSTRDPADGADDLRALRVVQLRVLGPNNPQTIQVLKTLANVAYRNADLAKSEEHLREAIKCLTEVHDGRDHEAVQELQAVLVDVLVAMTHHTEAMTELRELARSVAATDGPTAERALAVRFMLALLHYNTGEFAEAERELLALRDILDEEYPEDIEGRAIINWALGEILHRVGRLTDAEPVLLQAYSWLAEDEDYGPDHVGVLELQVELAEVLQEREKMAEAERHLQLALSVLRKDDEANPDLLRRAQSALTVVSSALKEIGPATEQPVVVEGSVDTVEIALPVPAIVDVHEHVDYEHARRLADQGFPLAAEAELVVVDSVLRRTAPDTTMAATVRIDIATSKVDRGDIAAGTRELRLLVRDATDRFGAVHHLTLRARTCLALADVARGHHDQAIRDLNEVLAVADNPQIRLALAKAFQASGAHAEAAAECRAALRTAPQNDVLRIRTLLATVEASHENLAAIVREQIRVHGSTHPAVAEARHHLGIALTRAGHHRAGRDELQAALAIRTRRLGRSHPATRATEDALATGRP